MEPEPRKLRKNPFPGEAEVVRLIQRGIKKAGSKGGLAGQLGMSKQTSNINKYLRAGRMPESRLQRLMEFLHEP